MGWFGPQSGDCSCCQAETPGICECVDGGIIVSKPDVTFTLGGTYGPAYTVSACGSAGTAPAGVLADYVLSCGETYQNEFFSFVCTDGLGINDYYYHITVSITYASNADDTEGNPLFFSVLSRVSFVQSGVTPTAANVTSLPVSSGFSQYSYSGGIQAGTCSTFDSPTELSQSNGTANHVDVSGVAVTVST